MQNHLEIKKILEKEIPKTIPKEWAQLNSKSREKIVNQFTDDFFEQMQSVELTLAEMRSRNETFNLFMVGILFGIVGGIVADIINSYLEAYGLVYQLIVALVFIILIFYIIMVVKKKNSSTFHSNKILVGLAKQAEKELQNMKNKDKE